MENKFNPIKDYNLPKEKLIKMYQDMLKIRYFENKQGIKIVLKPV